MSTVLDWLTQGSKLGSSVVNFISQQKNLNYQKQLQQKLFDREDTSYQRTVADMRNAGLNPLSMSSTNGSGATVSTTAPVSDLSDFNLSAIADNKLNRENLKAQTEFAKTQNDAKKLETENIKAQAQLLAEQIKNQRFLNDNSQKTLESDLALKSAQTYGAYASAGQTKANTVTIQLGNENLQNELNAKKDYVSASGENYWETMINSQADSQKALAQIQKIQASYALDDFNAKQFASKLFSDFNGITHTVTIPTQNGSESVTLPAGVDASTFMSVYTSLRSQTQALYNAIQDGDAKKASVASQALHDSLDSLKTKSDISSNEWKKVSSMIDALVPDLKVGF